MKLQPPNSAWCGPTALQNALRILGKRLGINRVAKACQLKTRQDHADQGRLMVAIEELGFRYEEIRQQSPTLARIELNGGIPVGKEEEEATYEGFRYNQLIKLRGKRPVLLCEQDYEHWVCVYPTFDRNYFFLFDSENTPTNTKENGCHVVHWNTLVKRWRMAGRKMESVNDCAFYGIRVMR